MDSAGRRRHTRVCVYDRAGRGWSEPADSPQDATQIATDLHTLLQRANVPGPYVLAGHSFGGLYVLTYADRYPDDVAGMVLIDSTNPATDGETRPRQRRTTPGSYDAATDRVAALGAAAARIGLVRLHRELRATATCPRSRVTRSAPRPQPPTTPPAGSTSSSRPTPHGAEAAMLTDFGDKPLVVLTAGAETDATHDAAQNKLATLSTNSSHRVVEGASHAALISDEQYAKATTQAILDVVSSVRSARPLVK